MNLSGFFIVAPSVVGIDEPFELKLKLLGDVREIPPECFPLNQTEPQLSSRYNLSPRGLAFKDNVLPEFEGSIDLSGGDGYEGPATYTFEGGRRPIAAIPGIRYTREGFHYITVTANGKQARSNPIRVCQAPPAERLFWGDTHAHTIFSDAIRSPEEVYGFARDEGFLDLFSMTDHAEALTDRQWDYFVSVANDYYEPGRFATLLALEWTNFEVGHRNVYYPGDYGPILRATDPPYQDLEGLYRAAREHGALLVPHHSANTQMGVKWHAGHDPEMERLVEIHSVWACSERAEHQGNPYPIRVQDGETDGQHVIDALNLGYRFGIIGSGDIHDGRPGDDLSRLQNMVQSHLTARQGIMGFWAKELTRESAFKAMWNRRVFGTMNVRVYLRFEVCGAFMGSTIRHDGSRQIRLEAASESPFTLIEIVRNGETVQKIEPGECEILWDTQDKGSGGTDYYYGRLMREDGQMAWSSPVWVEP